MAIASTNLPVVTSLATSDDFLVNAGGVTSQITQANALSPVDPRGIQTIWVPAGAMTARTTAGAVGGLIESATNKIMLQSMNFADGATVLYAQFVVRMPKSWDEGTVTASFAWTANSTSTNSVVWGIQGVALSNDNTIDTAFGTAKEVTDANTSTAYQVHLTNATAAMTLGNTPAAQDWCVFQVYRDPTNVADTLAATAILLGVTLNYTTDAATDA